MLSADPNQVPERIVARPRFSCFAPTEGAGSGNAGCYYRIRVVRYPAAGGTPILLRDYIEPYSQAQKTNGVVQRVYYAGRPPSAVVMITQPSFGPGDHISFEYYWQTWWDGNWSISVAIDSYDLELEKYYR